MVGVHNDRTDDLSGHVRVKFPQVGQQLLNRTAPARAAPERQDLFRPSQRLGDGLVETLPFPVFVDLDMNDVGIAA